MQKRITLFVHYYYIIGSLLHWVFFILCALVALFTVITLWISTECYWELFQNQGAYLINHQSPVQCFLTLIDGIIKTVQSEVNIFIWEEPSVSQLWYFYKIQIEITRVLHLPVCNSKSVSNHWVTIWVHINIGPWTAPSIHNIHWTQKVSGAGYNFLSGEVMSLPTVLFLIT